MIRARLPALFLVSAAAVGLETALTRYFAVAKWSEYGYWVISIAMAGFAFSGVTMALARDALVRRAPLLLAWLPPALVLAAAAGFVGVAANPFNPLELQNAATFAAQLWLIALYYAVLLPVFFLTGLYISLCFVLNSDRIGWVYGADLLGAGAGAALVLGLMWLVPPFRLVCVLLLPLALACWFGPDRRAGFAGLAMLLLGEAGLIFASAPGYNDFKPIYAPLHVPGSRVVAQVITPAGLYAVLDDFTERLDTDVSSNLALLNLPGPPESFGLYRDGVRIAALPKPGPVAAPYATAALAAFPYALRPHPRVLIAGSSGGFRVAEALALGASRVEVLEPDPVVARALRHGLAGSIPMPADPRVGLSTASPLAAASGRDRYDLVDLSADFLDEAPVNATAFTVESVAADLLAAGPAGIVSLPVSIRDFPVYALRVLGTARDALQAAGVADPAANVLVYRSAWNVRILLSRQAWGPAAIAALRAWCDERSFDVSYYPGMDLLGSRAGIYNDLPAVSFGRSPASPAAGADDAIADEAAAVLDRATTASSADFALAPATLDRPSYYNVLRLDHLGSILRRLEILPQPEIGQVVNLAVLAQAVVVALLVFAVPLWAGERLGVSASGALRPMLTFAALGLGFLMIELAAIERASLYLNNPAAAFALVLTAMLICSGLGSLLADHASPRAILLATGGAVLWCLLAAQWLLPAMLATLALPDPVRAVLVVAALAPLGVALGMPFPLALRQLGAGPMLPFAWAVNGAFSVVATPMANLLITQAGLHWVLLAAAASYAIAFGTSISYRKAAQWQPSPT